MNDFFQSACSPSREAPAYFDEVGSPTQSTKVSMKGGAQMFRVEFAKYNLLVTSAPEDILLKILAAANEAKGASLSPAKGASLASLSQAPEAGAGVGVGVGVGATTSTTTSTSTTTATITQSPVPSTQSPASKVAAFKERLRAARERESEALSPLTHIPRPISPARPASRMQQTDSKTPTRQLLANASTANASKLLASSRSPRNTPSKHLIISSKPKPVVSGMDFDLSKQKEFMPAFDKAFAQSKVPSLKFPVTFMEEPTEATVTDDGLATLINDENWSDENYQNINDPQLESIYDEIEGYNLASTSSHEMNPLQNKSAPNTNIDNNTNTNTNTDPLTPSRKKKMIISDVAPVVRETKASQLLKKYREESPDRISRSRSINRMRSARSPSNARPQSSSSTPRKRANMDIEQPSFKPTLETSTYKPHRSPSTPTHDKKSSSYASVVSDGTGCSPEGNSVGKERLNNRHEQSQWQSHEQEEDLLSEVTSNHMPTIPKLSIYLANKAISDEDQGTVFQRLANVPDRANMDMEEQPSFKPTLETSTYSPHRSPSREPVSSTKRASLYERTQTSTSKNKAMSLREEIARKKFEKKQEENAHLRFQPTLYTSEKPGKGTNGNNSQTSSPVKTTARGNDSPTHQPKAAVKSNKPKDKDLENDRFSRLYYDALQRRLMQETLVQKSEREYIARSTPTTPNRSFKKPYTVVERAPTTQRTGSGSTTSTYSSLASAIVRSPTRQSSPTKMTKMEPSKEFIQTCFVAANSTSTDFSALSRTSRVSRNGNGNSPTRSKYLHANEVNNENGSSPYRQSSSRTSNFYCNDSSSVTSSAAEQPSFKPQISKKAQNLVRDEDVGDRLYSMGQESRARFDTFQQEVLSNEASTHSPKLNRNKNSGDTLLERQEAFEKAKMEKLEKLKDAEDNRRALEDGATFSPVFESHARNLKLLEKRKESERDQANSPSRSPTRDRRNAAKSDESCTFQPQLVSKKQVTTQSEYSDVYSRLYYQGILNQSAASNELASYLEQELRETCPFTPVLIIANAIEQELTKRQSVFERLSDTEHANFMRECLDNLKDDLELRGCTFKPQLNKKTIELANKAASESCNGSVVSDGTSYSGNSVEDRLNKRGEQSQWQLEIARNKHQESLLSEVTSKPTIPKQSIYLANKAYSDHHHGTVFQRLSNVPDLDMGFDNNSMCSAMVEYITGTYTVQNENIESSDLLHGENPMASPKGSAGTKGTKGSSLLSSREHQPLEPFHVSTI